MGLSSPSALLAVLVVAAQLPEAVQGWVNGWDGGLNYVCPGDQGIMKINSVHSNNKEDRLWNYGCERIGASLGGTRISGWTNNFDGYQYYDCGGNDVIAGFNSYHSNNREDRRWRVYCRNMRGARLTNCRWNADANGWDGGMDQTAPSNGVFTGMKSWHSNGKEDRVFQFRTCSIECDRNGGYLRVGRRCDKQYCNSLSLTNGVLTGSCSGSFGGKCKYDRCNTGYELTQFGSAERDCTWVGNSVQWTGSAKECEDIDECLTGDNECYPGSVCVNTDGSYYCECLFGEQQGASCFVENPDIYIDQQLTEMTIHVSGEWTTEFPQYRVSVAKWSYDLAAKEDIHGFPKTIKTPLLDHRVINLEAGTRFRVTLTPVDFNDKEIPYFAQIAEVNGNDPQTICGCIPDDPTGSPTNFQVYQFKGHVLFKWSDESQCEDAFAFTRNGVGLAARFPVTEQLACSSIQEPLTIYDDLTIQSTGGFAEPDERENYQLPEGSFYLRRSEALEQGQMRFKYPRELQKEGGYFSSTSTTTTTGGPAIPVDERRFFPGTSSPVTSVSECKDLCELRSDWCVAFVAQTTDKDELICHQLRVVEEAQLTSREKKAVSYERLVVNGTGVTGTYIFEGTQEDCEQACAESNECEMIFVDEGVCGTMSKAILALPGNRTTTTTTTTTSTTTTSTTTTTTSTTTTITTTTQTTTTTTTTSTTSSTTSTTTTSFFTSSFPNGTNITTTAIQNITITLTTTSTTTTTTSTTTTSTTTTSTTTTTTTTTTVTTTTTTLTLPGSPSANASTTPVPTTTTTTTVETTTTTTTTSTLNPHIAISPFLDPTYSRRIPGPEPGTTQEYCIRAVKPEWYDPQGYSSEPTCSNYTIEWESYIEGQILIESREIHLPVEHVQIEFEIGGEVRGRRITNEDGKFYIHVLTDKLRGSRHPMTLRFSKTTGNIKHTFSCGGLPCSEQTIIMEHLRFDQKVEVRDTTSAPFSGIVSIGGTEHEGLPDGCPLKDVEVCLYDRHQANTLINCDFTDAKGRYLVRSVLGTSVTVGLTFQNSSHTFQRVSYKRNAANAPSGVTTSTLFSRDPVYVEYFDITEDKMWENINYKDVTTDVATVDIAGGLCNLTLGDAVMEFRYDMCPTWVREEVISKQVTRWRLPAQIMTVRFKEITRNYEVRAEITRYFSATLGNSRSLYADLRNPEDEEQDKKTVRFEYHPPPQLTVEFSKRIRQDCNTTSEDGELRPLNVLEFNQEMKATVRVIEDYGEGVGTCDAVPGVIEIVNQLGETPADVDILNATTGLSDKQLTKLKQCHDPCELPVVMDEQEENGVTKYSNTHVEIEIMTGSPETNPQALSPEFPHTKLFRASMHNLPHDPVAVYEKVVVVGDKVISEYFSVPFPRYKPLTVIQDPPGGLSTVTYSKAYANFMMHSESHEEFHGFYLSTDLAAIQVQDESDSCVGLGAAVCKKILTTESTPLKLHFETDNAWGGKNAEKNYGTERVWSFGIDLTTSDDPMMAGINSDMFLVPALNVVWLETEEVSFDTEMCQAELNTKVKWSLKGEQNKELLSWVSAFEIETKELPDLRKLLKLAQESPDPDDDEEDQQAKIDELQRAIDAWEDNLARNKAVRQDASNGLLDPIQKMWGQGSAQHQCVPTVEAAKNPMKAMSLQSKVTKVHACDSFDNSHLRDIGGKGISLAPHDLVDNVESIDGSDVTDEKKQELREVNIIKFSGGGSTYTFSYDFTRTDNALSSSHRTHDVQAGLSGDVDFKIFGIGMSFEGAAGYHYQGDKEVEDDAGVERSATVEFTLGDPDPLDVFDVEVYLHPDYGTLVFHTSSGQSSCPHEPNTVHLERPGISILKRPLAPVLPDEPAVFELLLTNDGPRYSDFNLFMLNSENQDSLGIFINTQELATSIDFEGFPPGARYVTAIVERGVTKYKYDPIPLGFRSLCEADRHPDNGYLNDEVTTVEYIYLEAEFLQECSPVRLVGEIGESGVFTLNAETMEQDYKPGQVRVVTFNPDHAARTWLEDDRLEKVVIEFKPVSSYVWLLARDDKGDALDIRERANEYGYVTSWWDASTLMEGDYHLRVRAQCTASINEMPDGIDVKHSAIVTGRVDRDPPVVFGFPEPADGEFFPGDAMSFEFNEPIECRQPFIFQVSLTVEGYNRDFNNNNMVIVCEGRKIAMSLRRGFRYDDVNGLTAKVVIENVKDLNDNPIVDRLPEHTFQFAELNLADASAAVSGLVLAIPYQTAYADTSSQAYAQFEEVVSAEVAQVVGVDASRVTIVSVEPADASNYANGVSLSLRFKPASEATTTTNRRRRASEPSATDLASLLQERLADGVGGGNSNVTLLAGATTDNIEVEVEPSADDTAQAATSSSSGDSTGAVDASSSSSGATVYSGDSFLGNWDRIKTDIILIVVCLQAIALVGVALFRAKKQPRRTSSRVEKVVTSDGTDCGAGGVSKSTDDAPQPPPSRSRTRSKRFRLFRPTSSSIAPLQTVADASS